MTGERRRDAVIPRLPLHAATAEPAEGTSDSSVGVAPGFQWKICRFHAPPVYPASVGMKLSTLPAPASLGKAAWARASCTAGTFPVAPTMWKTTLPAASTWACCGDEVTSAVAWYSIGWLS